MPLKHLSSTPAQDSVLLQVSARPASAVEHAGHSFPLGNKFGAGDMQEIKKETELIWNSLFMILKLLFVVNLEFHQLLRETL